MNILDKIKTAPDNTRVSFLHPDRAAESICDIQELRDAIDVEVKDQVAALAEDDLFIPESGKPLGIDVVKMIVELAPPRPRASRITGLTTSGLRDVRP